MISEKAKLSAKYLYVRCDENFQLKFTNGSTMPFWKGFYCLLTEDLQKYNTNNEVVIEADDIANIWWLSSDTLIMSVTDINTSMLGVLSEIANNNANANLSQLASSNQQTALLMSIQNTLSTFLNTYVQLHNVVDYGFQTAMIGRNNVCDLYIAKPSGGYSFNCTISYQHNFNASRSVGSGTVGAKAWRLYGVDDRTTHLSGNTAYWTNLFKFQNMSANNSTGGYIDSVHFDIVADMPFEIGFRLFDNENSLLTGYSITNISASYDFSIASFANGYGTSRTTGEVTRRFPYSYSFSGNFPLCSFGGGAFTLGGASFSKHFDLVTNDLSAKTQSFSETLSINFDVSYTPS